jgi:O-antigen ligase
VKQAPAFDVRLIFLAVATAILHVVLRSDGIALWPVALFAALSACAFAFVLNPASRWVLVVAASVPIEFTRQASWGAYSPIDYLALAALPAFIWRLRSPLLKRHFLQTIASAPSLAFFGFLLLAFVLNVLKGGYLRDAMRWGEWFFWFLVSLLASREDGQRDWLQPLLTFLGTAIASLAVVQFLRGHYDYRSVVGLFGHSNAVGSFLTLTLPSAAAWWFSSRRRHLKATALLLATALSATALGLTYSRGAWIGLAIGVLVALFQFPSLRSVAFRPALLIIAVVALTIAGWVTLQTNKALWTLSGRNLLLEGGFRLWFDHLWLGVGPGHYTTIAPEYIPLDRLRQEQIISYFEIPRIWPHVHNLYLQLLVGYGLIGAGLLFATLTGFVAKGLRSNIVSGSRLNSVETVRLSGYLISCMAFLGHNLFDVLTVSSFDILWGFILAKLINAAAPTERSQHAEH